METIPAFAIAVALIGATDAEGEHARTPLDRYEAQIEALQTSPEANNDRIETTIQSVIGNRECRDRIHQARDFAGLPRIERQPASPANPYAIYAVDRRQEGCSVMLMMGTRNDIRPLPGPAEGSPFLLIPAQDGKR